MNTRQQKRYYPTNSSAWRAIRERVLREQPYCACGCRGLSVEVDHIDGKCETRHDNRRENLQGMTHECHSVKTAIENGSFGRPKGQAKRAGCDSRGLPLDGTHHWRMP